MTGFDSVFNKRLSRPLIFAHRGAGHWGRGAAVGENTMAAFWAAHAAGADGIEIDVRRTVDGTLIVHHDLRLPGYRMPIPVMSYAEVQAASRSTGYAVPTLAETVRFCAGRMLLDVELKEAGYEAAVLAACQTMMRKSRVIFTSFHPAVVAAIKSVAGEAKAGLLVGLRQAGKSMLRRGGESPLALAQECGADFIAPHWRLATASFCRRAHDAHVPVVVWTVNHESAAGRLIDNQVAAIITDRPNLIIPSLPR